jgi:hypothetical protein
MNGTIKLKCYITVDWKGLPGTNSLKYLPIWKLHRNMLNMTPVAYLQHFIFFVTYKRVQLAKKLHYTRTPVTHSCYKTISSVSSHSIYLNFHLSVGLLVCLFACLSFYVFIYLSVTNKFIKKIFFKLYFS